MNRGKTLKENDYFSFEDIVLSIKQELEDARDEHERLSTILMRNHDDEDVYILEDYTDDLQEYIDEMENLTNSFENLTDIKGRLAEDMEEVKSKFKQLGLL